MGFRACVPENSAWGNPGQGGTGLGTWLRILGHSLRFLYSPPPLEAAGETETNIVYPLITEDLLSHTACVPQMSTNIEKKGKITPNCTTLSVKFPPTCVHVKHIWDHTVHLTLLKLFCSITPLFTKQWPLFPYPATVLSVAGWWFFVPGHTAIFLIHFPGPCCWWYDSEALMTGWSWRPAMCWAERKH